jgi:hypothetical protein
MSQAPQPPPPPEQPPTRPPAGGPPSSGSGRSGNLWTAVGVGAGVVVLAVVLFLLLKPDDDSENTAATTPTQQTTTSAETTTKATTNEETTTEVTTTAPANEPQRIRIEVENAEPVGGVQRYEVDEGAEVVLVVTADVEDEVHLHGYDLPADVAPDHPARIQFQADLVGEFEIELEERKVPIGELVVS